MKTSSIWMRTVGAAFGIVMLLVGVPASALAHAELQEARPGRGDKLSAAPRRIVLSFSEPAAPQAALEVRDGCGRSLQTAVRIDAGRVVANVVGSGRPGSWRISYDVLSAVDGHPYKGSYTFTVEGERACNRKGPSAAPLAVDDNAQGGPSGDSSLMPLLIASGAVVIAGAAGSAWSRRRKDERSAP